MLCPEPTLEQRAQVKREKGARGEIKKFKKDQKKEALKQMEKEAFGLPVTKEVLDMDNILLCDDCSPSASKKSASSQGRSGKKGEMFGDRMVV